MAAIKINIPGYQIKQQIGSGGMSVVYLAEQLSLHREVALKVMRPVVEDESHTIERFEHEAKTIAQLYHPNIMSIYDVGHLEDGTLFYAMPHLTHGDLSHIEWKDDDHIKAVFEGICDGLSFAHEHGVIHRDLKPENILFDSFGHPQIADFGIAISQQHKKWTKDNRIVGSIQYISPEQAQSQPIDARSDIYAVGAMLYEALTGHTVFQETDELALMLAHVSKKPEPLPASKQQWQPVVSKCLAKSAKHRYQDAGQLKAAIAAVNSNDVLTQSRPQIKNKSGWIFGITTVLVLATVYFWPSSSKPTETQNNNSQFISTGNNTAEPPPNDLYVELSETSQNNALELLTQRLNQPWEPGVADSLLESLLLHVTTQPELSLTIAETYINKVFNDGLMALNETDFERTATWQKQLLKSQQVFKDIDPLKPLIEQQILQIEAAINNTFNSLPAKQQQKMTQTWPLLASQKAQIQKRNKHDLPVIPLSQSRKLGITATEITVGQFRPFANATALEPERCKNPTTSSLRFSSKTWSNPGFLQKNNHPVVCVTWQQATDYARWLSQKTGHSYRLPKANEWLMAKPQSPAKCNQHNVAGGETQHLKIKQNRHSCEDAFIQTSPVKTHPAVQGVFGMQGNAKEWLQGCKKKNKIQSFFSDSNECDSHPAIGQSWLSGQQDLGDVSYEKSGQAWVHIGFRLIKEL
ncbi:bifunctional serine/threonine-protein kinase/formylglycine-generating enzyme family protein [Marinicella rhabdoformis]|uniref:bifunctional serine/threonine-protein kinase/formylglycine-generating enzyme family protein n=1 Tax=Marinicella rhabdoformis TaxID=2580566 RepID=UPI0012AED024|nr:bifunctional serine/threonine-protein kinase/formylglycine-generating enzyme family protein [Marinicella rhabdoformis]